MTARPTALLVVSLVAVGGCSKKHSNEGPRIRELCVALGDRWQRRSEGFTAERLKTLVDIAWGKTDASEAARTEAHRAVSTVHIEAEAARSVGHVCVLSEACILRNFLVVNEQSVASASESVKVLTEGFQGKPPCVNEHPPSTLRDACDAIGIEANALAEAGGTPEYEEFTRWLKASTDLDLEHLAGDRQALDARLHEVERIYSYQSSAYDMAAEWRATAAYAAAALPSCAPPDARAACEAVLSGVDAANPSAAMEMLRQVAAALLHGTPCNADPVRRAEESWRNAPVPTLPPLPPDAAPASADEAAAPIDAAQVRP